MIDKSKLKIHTLIILGWLVLFVFQASAQIDSDKKTENNTNSPSKVEINRKPLMDFADEILKRWERDKNDFTKPFLVELEGYLTKEGRLDAKKSRFTRIEGDEEMTEIARQAIEAIGDSGWLGYLKNMGVKKINFIFSQNNAKTFFKLSSEMKSIEKAKTIAIGLRNMNSMIVIAHKQGKRKLKNDEIFFLEGVKIHSQDKKFVMRANYDKSAFHKIINKHLKEYKEYTLKKRFKKTPQ